MSRIVSVLGYAIFILALLGEASFIGLVSQLVMRCGLSLSCYNQFYYIGGGIPSTIYNPFILWNAFTYAVLALVGIALILLGSREARTPSSA